MRYIEKAATRASALVALAFAIVLLVVLVLGTRTAEAQEGDIGLYHQAAIDDNGKVSHRFFSEGYYLGEEEKYGIWGFGYGEQQYGSAVVGPLMSFTLGRQMFVMAGVALGAETYPEEDGKYNLYPRVAAFVEISIGRFYGLGYYEGWKRSEGWLRVQLDWQVTESWAAGLFHQTGDGVGPRVIYSIPSTPINIWVSKMFGEKADYLGGVEAVAQFR